MRFKINKEAYGKSSFQKNTEDSYSKSERALALVLDLPACSSERDARKPASPAQISRSAVTSSSCEFKGPLKKDGTPDMRFASNNQSASSMSSLSSYSSASGPIKKKDNAPDMRYAANKSSYDGPSSSGYCSGGSFYSTELLASLASPGPLESDGTPDMRYAANRSSYASPCSYGGSAYSSGSSSIDGTPDMDMQQTTRAMMVHLPQGIGLYTIVLPRMGDQTTAPDRLLVKVVLMDPARVDH